jgi:hypothetical protein
MDVRLLQSGSASPSGAVDYKQLMESMIRTSVPEMALPEYPPPPMLASQQKKTEGESGGVLYVPFQRVDNEALDSSVSFSRRLKVCEGRGRNEM